MAMDHVNFLWDNNQTWVTLLSNSDNSGGGATSTGVGGMNNKKLLLPIDSSSNCPTPTAATTPQPAVPAGPNKRGRSGAPPKGAAGNNKTTTDGADAAEWSNINNKTTNIGAGGGASGSGGGGGESDHEIHIWTERERRKKMRNMFSSLHALLPQLPPKADKSTIVDEAVNYIKNLQHTLQKLQKQRLDLLRGGGGGGAMTTPLDYDQQPSTIIASSCVSGFNSREAFLADQTAAAGSASCRTTSNAIILPINNNINTPPSLSLTCMPSTFETWSSPNVVLSVNGEDAQISVCSAKKPGLFSTVLYVLEKYKLEVVTAHISSDQYRSMYMIHARASGMSCEQFPELLPVEEIYKLAVGEIIFWLTS